MSDSLVQAIKAIPNQPGIYIFSDINGVMLYVGKSIKLRNRVNSYFTKSNSNHYNIKTMIPSIHSIEYQLAYSELHALLLENKAIKQYRPPYNTKQKEFPEYRYLFLTLDEYPALKELENISGLPIDRIFGPFKDTYLIAELLAIIAQIFQIRTCTDTTPIRKCLNYELGKCLGPCFSQDVLDDYQNNLILLQKFFSGDSSYIIDHLQTSINEYTALLKYERAAEQLAQIHFIERFCQKQRFNQQFAKEKLILPDIGCFHVFAYGSYIDTTTTFEDASKIFNSINTTDLNTDPRYIYDLANIVFKYAHLDLGKSKRI